jgi:hypothetical protein
MEVLCEIFFACFINFLFLGISWGFIESNYKKDNLCRINGIVIKINEVQARNTKKTQDYELRLYINNYPKYFRITDSFKYESILKKVTIGDKISIYYRPKYLVLLGMGRQTDI